MYVQMDVSHFDDVQQTYTLLRIAASGWNVSSHQVADGP
jgi:hypothetical protein